MVNLSMSTCLGNAPIYGSPSEGVTVVGGVRVLAPIHRRRLIDGPSLLQIPLDIAINGLHVLAPIHRCCLIERPSLTNIAINGFCALVPIHRLWALSHR